MYSSISRFIYSLAASLAFLSMALCLPLSVNAQSTPRWVDKGVKDLNKQRTNNTYDFWVFHDHGPLLEQLEEDSEKALMEYVSKTYYSDSLEITQLSVEPKLTYKVQFTNISGKRTFVIAQLVDTYSKFEDFELNHFEYEFYQLYAISKPGLEPQFDDITITRKYNALATVRSIIPGLGQLYKGQKTKAGVIIGGEILFVGAGIYFDSERRYAHNQRNDPFTANSWKSKETAWRTFMYGAFGCAGALYIYNLFDAAISKGAPQIVISRHKGPRQYLTILPYAAPDNMGIAARLQF